MKRIVVNVALCLSGPLVVIACADPPVYKSGGQQQAAVAPAASASASASASAQRPDYTENDFVENENNRDPFHSYVVQTVPTGPKPLTRQIQVKLAEYAVDELKLAAIVQAGTGTRAMFMPPNGFGISVFRGDYVGRAEIVHIGGANGPEYQLNWRVDKIRDGDVVLIREDRAQPSIPPATRVILLHPETNDKKG
jgi:type IV pilus assembly protein PilP